MLQVLENSDYKCGQGKINNPYAVYFIWKQNKQVCGKTELWTCFKLLYML